jgi:hypothetical protein
VIFSHLFRGHEGFIREFDNIIKKFVINNEREVIFQFDLYLYDQSYCKFVAIVWELLMHVIENIKQYDKTSMQYLNNPSVIYGIPRQHPEVRLRYLKKALEIAEEIGNISMQRIAYE